MEFNKDKTKNVSNNHVVNSDIRVFNLIDAHCHIDDLSEENISDSLTYLSGLITNSVNLQSCIKNLDLSKKYRNVYVELGIHPEFSNIKENELSQAIRLIEENKDYVVGIGEIGLDYSLAKTDEEKSIQQRIFSIMVDEALKLDLPVSIHSRDALKDVFKILDDKKAKKVHIHFFEGDEEDARICEERGYYISIPPLKSSKRMRAIKEISINNIMAETDSPTADKLPKDVIDSIKLISSAKGTDLEETAKLITRNTKRFFGIKPNLQNLLKN